MLFKSEFPNVPRHPAANADETYVTPMSETFVPDPQFIEGDYEEILNELQVYGVEWTSFKSEYSVGLFSVVVTYSHSTCLLCHPVERVYDRMDALDRNELMNFYGVKYDPDLVF